MRYLALPLIAMAGCLAGCGTVQLSPVVSETRPVVKATDPAKRITVPEGMVWYDSATPTRGLRFPASTYVLEAEDADYWYLRSAEPLEFRILKNGQVIDGGTMAGGIMLAKHFSLVPGAAYIDGEGASKVMVWKLGADFLSLEGHAWKKSF